MIESHKTKDEFLRDYRIYVELLRDLAKEAGIRTTLDTGELGIITHDYARRHQPYNQTDHVDPYPYLAKWGISREQFKKDVENGISGGGSTTPPVKPPVKKVELLPHATHYSKSSKGTKIADWVKKQKIFEYDMSRPISQSYSNTEYRLINKGTPIGWVLSQDIKGGYGNEKVGKTTPKPTPKPKPSTGKWIAEKGRFTVGASTAGAKNVAVSKLPLTVNATGSGAKIADISKGNAIDYDAFMNDGKYIWIRQPRSNGYGYMATGNVKNGKRDDYWGAFSSR